MLRRRTKSRPTRNNADVGGTAMLTDIVARSTHSYCCYCYSIGKEVARTGCSEGVVIFDFVKIPG